MSKEEKIKKLETALKTPGIGSDEKAIYQEALKKLKGNSSNSKPSKSNAKPDKKSEKPSTTPPKNSDKKDNSGSSDKKQTNKERLAKRQEELKEIQQEVNGAEKLPQSRVLAIASKINSTRKLSAQVIDGGKNHETVLKPTFDNLKRWAKNPGKYDLQGVDTAQKDTPVTKEFKKKYTPKKRSIWDKIWNG